MTLNESYKIVCEKILNGNETKHDMNSAILALHESATKLWQATENEQSDKIKLRAANALISVFHVMCELGIEDLESCLLEKINEAG